MVFRTAHASDEWLPVTHKMEREAFAKDLAALSVEKVERLKFLIRNNIEDCKIFFLPRPTKDKLLSEMDTVGGHKAPRFALAVRMLLKNLRKGLVDI